MPWDPEEGGWNKQLHPFVQGVMIIPHFFRETIFESIASTNRHKPNGSCNFQTATLQHLLEFVRKLNGFETVELGMYSKKHLFLSVQRGDFKEKNDCEFVMNVLLTFASRSGSRKWSRGWGLIFRGDRPARISTSTISRCALIYTQRNI